MKGKTAVITGGTSGIGEDWPKGWEWESFQRLTVRPRYRQRGLAPWRPKVIDAKPSNNSELEQPIASENERTT
jgi:hypothetical protein